MKNILLFAEGTSENSRGGEDGIKTNIGKLYDLAVKDQTQVVGYRYGVGSKNNPLVKYVQRAVGYGLRNNMMVLYKQLSDIYAPGDEIFVFGFSRGSYTVRSLVGLINAFGIVPRANSETLNAIEDMYRIPPEFRKYYPAYKKITEMQSYKTRIKFVGVFDSVSSLGFPFPAALKVIAENSLPPIMSGAVEMLSKVCVGYHDTTLRNVDYAYQAVALDERRSSFLPALWTEANDPDLKEIKQVWFSGNHSNIGGGYKDTGLSDITLLWMMQKAIACGARFNSPDVKPDIMGEMPNEFSTWYYKITSTVYRQAGEQLACKEYLHEAALLRHKASIFGGEHKKNLVVNYTGYDNASRLPIEK